MAAKPIELDLGDAAEALSVTLEAENDPDTSEEAESSTPRPRGRPRGDGMPSGSVPKDYPVPGAPRRTFKNISPHPNTNSSAAWKWWNNLPEWALKKIDAYVYRDQPVLLDPPRDANGKPLYYKNIGIIPGETPIQDDLDLLNRFGCGSYHVIISETGSDKREDKGMCTIWVQNVGGGDYRSNPPSDDHVSDPEKIDQGHPANASYIAYLKGAGRWPGENESKAKEEDMATAQVVEQVLGENKALVRELIDTAKSQVKDRDKDKGANERAGDIAIELVADGAKRNAAMMEATFHKLLGDAKGSAPAGNGADPLATALQIVELIERKTPAPVAVAPTTDPEVAELRRQIHEMRRDELAALREQNKALMDAKVTAPTAQTSPFAFMDSGIESVEKLGVLIDRIRGGREPESNMAEQVAEDLGPKWLMRYEKYIPMALGLGQGVLQAFLQSRQPQQMQPQYYAPTQVYSPQSQQQQPAPGLALVQPKPNGLPDHVSKLLDFIAPNVQFCLQMGMTGSEFAEWFQKHPDLGIDMYADVAKMGVDKIIGAMRIHPSTSAMALHNPEMPDFIGEFCSPVPELPEDEEENLPQPA